jgi:hypothetical protein
MFTPSIKRLTLPIIICIAYLNTGIANAQLLTTSLSTTIDSVVTDAMLNPFSLMAGDTVSLSFTYDSSLISIMGDSEIFLDESSNSLAFNFGSLSFTEMDDIDYLSMDPGFGPTAFFTDGALTGFAFLAELVSNMIVFEIEIGELPGEDTFFAELFNVDELEIIASAEFDLTQATTVPLGPALPLFISALGMLGLGYKKRKT